MQLYAAEYWTDYVLAVIDSEKGLETQPRLLNLISRLIMKFDSSQVEEYERFEELTDRRLEYLEQHENVRVFICRDLKRANLKRFEEQLKQERGDSAAFPPFFVRS